MKVLKWILVALLVMVVLPLAAVIAINAFDESLTPEAASYGEPRAPGVPDAENGYLALLALTAGDGEDGAAYAKAWLAEARAAAKENRMERRPEVKRSKRPDLCDAALESCLAAVQGRTAEVASQLDVYREDLERYEKLISFPRYEEILDYPLRVTPGFPRYGDLRKAQQAYLARAALAAVSGNLEQAVAAIERDLAFQRTMLGGSRTLLGKMVACAGYWRDLAFIADLLQSRPADLAPRRARLQAALKAIGPAALRLSPVIETEFAFAKHFLKDPMARAQGERTPEFVERLVLTLFYKSNATINREAARLSAFAAGADLPVNEGSAELNKVLQRESKMRFWDYVDNPGGNLLRRWAMPEDGTDAYNRLRLHDLDAYNRLLGLRVEMMAAEVTADGVAAFIAKSDARFHDPYTGKPMTWDAATRQLAFRAHSRALVNRKLFNVDKGRVYLQL